MRSTWEAPNGEARVGYELDPTTVELKASLMAAGMVLDRETELWLTNADRPVTLADYASTSGVSLVLPGDVWVNAPIDTINANFVVPGQTRLSVVDGTPCIVRYGHEPVPVRFIPVPDYHNKVLSDGTRVTDYAITHTDRVRISPIRGCSMTCDYCDIPFDREPDQPKYRGTKPIENLVESVRIALGDPTLPAQHVLISGGTPRKVDYGYEMEVYEAIAAAFPGVDVDVMMVPMPGLMDLARLKAAGIHGFSINLELFNEEIAKRYMLNKAKASRQLYFDFIERAVAEFGIGRVRSLMLVGLEPLEDTLRGVEELAKRGCDPVLSPFRPDPKTPLRETPPPSAELLMEAWMRSQEIVSQYPGVVMGPRCIPCMHNCFAFPDDSGVYQYSTRRAA